MHLLNHLAYTPLTYSLTGTPYGLASHDWAGQFQRPWSKILETLRNYTYLCIWQEGIESKASIAQALRWSKLIFSHSLSLSKTWFLINWIFSYHSKCSRTLQDMWRSFKLTTIGHISNILTLPWTLKKRQNTLYKWLLQKKKH